MPEVRGILKAIIFFGRECEDAACLHRYPWVGSEVLFCKAVGEFPDASEVVRKVQGPFDSAGASLREVPAPPQGDS